MVVRKKKYQSGEASNFVTRKQALHKLQLNLKDFRRLCILKGIHPREPRNRKRAQKGDLHTIKTLYHEKDIRFLMHEPIVWKFRDFKVFLKKLKRATEKGNEGAAERLKANKPKYTLDHIVKERYPTFIDAIRDLEDCLCLCFLYSTFPKNAKTPIEMISLCRRLCIEFLHYVIEAKALRKVFVSIKGYYYQAEILGQQVTWVVPHAFAYEHPQNVDIRLMSIFVEFYTTVLGFVNYRLYHNLNLIYPPALITNVASTMMRIGQDDEINAKDKGSTEEEKVVDKLKKNLTGSNDNEIQQEMAKDRVAALNQSLARSVASDEDKVEIDNIPMNCDGDINKIAEATEEAKKELDDLNKLQGLFKGLKIFLNREVPRESLVFMIRAFGGQVSWDATVSPGATYNEDDSKITHQICDRPKETLRMMHIGRDYVQPQWIFDSINQKKLLPVHKYFLGEMLPPHLSPFIKEERRVGDYIPPEEKELLGLEKGNENTAEDSKDNDVEEDESESDDDSDASVNSDDEEAGDLNMQVNEGQAQQSNKAEEERLMEDEQYRLRVMMVKKKHKGLYRSMMKARKKRVHESKQLERKRKIHDDKKVENPIAATTVPKKSKKQKSQD